MFQNMIMSDAKYQLRNIMIDGLNMPDKDYNWGDFFYLTPIDALHNKKNFGMTYLLIDKPLTIPKDGELIENYFRDADEQNSIILYYTTLFLACYHLIDYKVMPQIVWRNSASVTIHNPKKDVPMNLRCGGGPNVETKLPMTDPKDVEIALDKTYPLFQKVLAISKIKRKKGKENTLIVALIVYQLTMEKSDSIRNFLDFITILEALFTNNDGEISYKLSLRLSVFLQTDSTKRHALFDTMRDAYDKRSALVHGDDITLKTYSSYVTYKNQLEPLVRESLLRYIELMSNGKDKESILIDIDHSILG